MSRNTLWLVGLSDSVSYVYSMFNKSGNINDQPAKQTALHLGMCLSIAVLWGITGALAFTPNNKLREFGLGNAIAIDMTIGVLIAFAIAVFSISKRRTCPNATLFFTTQVLAWGHSIGLIILFAFAAMYALQHGA